MLVAALALGLLSAGCAARLSGAEVPSAGTYKKTMDVRAGGFRRTYWFHVPKGYDGATPLPLVVAIHGAFSGAQGLERQSGLSELADREGFIVVYPNGIGLFGLLRHWNAGHCCAKARKSGLDDVGFVATVVEEVSSRLAVDRSRIYIVGHSNGGMLTHRIAAEGRLAPAAVAAVSATIGGKPSEDEPEWVVPPPVAPVPIMLVHGNADEHVPYAGGRGPKSRGDSSTVSVERTVSFWVEHNRCAAEPESTRYRNGGVRREIWEPCAGGATVELHTLEGWAHNFPGPPLTQELDEGDPLRGFSVAEVIWAFLKEHRRPAEDSAAGGS